MQFHYQVSLAYKSLRSALSELSRKINESEDDLLKHWGIQIDETGEDNIIKL